MTLARKLNDPLLLALGLAATLLGLVFIFDAGYGRSIKNETGTIPPEFTTQVKNLIAAVAAWLIGSRISSKAWLAGSRIFWIGSLMAVFAVKVFGHAMGGATRWIDLGPVSVQPSEFLKVATVVYLAGVFANRKTWPEVRKPAKTVADWLDRNLVAKLGRWLPAVWVMVGAVAVVLEPDLGTGAVIFAAAACMFILGGTHWKTLVLGFLMACLLVVVAVKAEPYRMKRITNHPYRWETKNVDEIGYQTAQSELAQATGGWFGVGPGTGRAKLLLPATTTDFIMATVGEETGFAGSLVIILVIGGLCWRLLYLARGAGDEFSRLVLAGTASWFAVQSCTNIMMANATLPAIGIPLPFISSGGSSLVALWLVLGICESAAAPAPAKEASPEAHSDGWRNGRTRLSGA